MACAACAVQARGPGAALTAEHDGGEPSWLPPASFAGCPADSRALASAQRAPSHALVGPRSAALSRRARLPRSPATFPVLPRARLPRSSAAFPALPRARPPRSPAAFPALPRARPPRLPMGHSSSRHSGAPIHEPAGRPSSIPSSTESQDEGPIRTFSGRAPVAGRRGRRESAGRRAKGPPGERRSPGEGAAGRAPVAGRRGRGERRTPDTARIGCRPPATLSAKRPAIPSSAAGWVGAPGMVGTWSAYHVAGWLRGRQRVGVDRFRRLGPQTVI